MQNDSDVLFLYFVVFVYFSPDFLIYNFGLSTFFTFLVAGIYEKLFLREIYLVAFLWRP